MSNHTNTCNLCVNNHHYITGDDEYPQRTCIAYCSKGHWENSDPSDPEMDSVVNCLDFDTIPITVDSAPRYGESPLITALPAIINLGEIERLTNVTKK